MAIAPTGAIYKSLSFDNTSSRSYGVYITGQAVYNAPERDVEMITIPNRNGVYALDNGRFENITVTYPAGIYADSEADFAQAISDFRNFLCSKRGYCRLTDEYNPNEYRLAIYKSGLEVSPDKLRAGEFEITFECKPQRFLTSGETAVSVANGGTLTNPTLFESGPLLILDGYGTVSFNGNDIEVDNIVYGPFISVNAGNDPAKNTTLSLIGEFETGDSISFPQIKIDARCYHNGYNMSGSSITDTSPKASTTSEGSSNNHYLHTVFSNLSFVAGTSSSVSNTATQNCTLTLSGYTPTTATYTLTVTVSYDGNSTITITTSGTASSPSIGGLYPPSVQIITWSDITIDSTAHIAGLLIYVDCDFGEAYQINGDDLIPLNAYIDLGSELPTLASGSNTITFDNTFTSVKIAPRWWKV